VSLAEKLTPAQKTAVENRGGKLLVSAAAGSGKTKVLVDRLFAYMTDPVAPANIDDFLIITYTKAAAAELRTKIADKLTQFIALHPENRHMQQQIQRLYLAKISTVHSFCADILREYAYQLDISTDFRIAEENECMEIMTQALEKLLDDAYSVRMDRESFREFIDSQGLGRDDRQIPEIILQIHSRALCHLNPNQWLDWCQEIASVSNVQDVSETLWGNYLIQDLKNYLSMQITSLQNCIDRTVLIPGLEKPVALLQATVSDLLSLQNCSTWDDIVNHPPVAYGTMTFKKEHKGSMLSEEIKAIRSACKDGLNKKLKAFSDQSCVILQQMKQSHLACCELISLVKEFRSL
jgi:ATP-dependent helicase/nuclease subunit A